MQAWLFVIGETYICRGDFDLNYLLSIESAQGLPVRTHKKTPVHQHKSLKKIRIVWKGEVRFYKCLSWVIALAG